jgi:hypothetical protein
MSGLTWLEACDQRLLHEQIPVVVTWAAIEPAAAPSPMAPCRLAAVRGS